MEEENLTRKVIDIARRSLKACYLNGMIIASAEKFRDYWARDTFFALPGVIKAGDNKIARNCISGFLEFQRSDGKIPRKIVRNRPLPMYLFGKHIRRKKPKPIFRGLIPGFSSTDGNALLVIAVENYLKETDDTKFVKDIYEKLLLAMSWYRVHKSTGFVHSYFLSDWMDSVFKTGPVLYSNVLYCRALRSMENIAREIENKSDEEKFENEYNNMHKRLNERFWNGEFFSNRSNKRSGRFDSAGNILACYLNVAEYDKRALIAKKIVDISYKGGLIPAIYPKYPFWRINPYLVIFLFPDYHGESCWLWINLYAVRVLKQNGQVEASNNLMHKISEMIIRDDTVGETYFRDGRVYKKTFWRSVSPFAWSSGVCLEILL